MMGDHTSTPEMLLKALLERWPRLTTVIVAGTFSPDTNPGPFIQTITAQDGPNKNQFLAMLDCLEENTRQLTAQRDQIQSELSKRVRNVSDLDELVAVQRSEADKMRQAFEETRAEITGLNSTITSLNTRVAQNNERISELQDERAELRTRLSQATTTATAPAPQPEMTSKPRRTTTNPDKFTAGQKDIAKRQEAYEKWKTQVESVLVTDANCFLKALDTLTFITSLLSGKAWDAVQDGVQKMNANPTDPEQWTWHDVATLWKALDKRYILLDSTQSAKNTLDTLFQEMRAYGDFKADFDYYADKAMLDDRTKVDMLRKRLNVDFTRVIDNQIILPAVDDYTGWSNTTDNIARNLQQKQHIAKLQNLTRLQNPASPHPQARAAPAPAPAVDTGDPMELDRIHISDAERKRRKDNDLCLACGESGHFARDHHRPVDPIPMPQRRNTYTPGNARGRGHGRGGYNGQAGQTQPQGQQGRQGQNQQRGAWQWVPQPQSQQPQFMTPQLRALPTTGHIISETSSENTSIMGDDSFSTVPDMQGQQLKDLPLD